MSDRFRLITAPTVEPIALSDVKTELRVDHSDDDILLGYLITAARQRAEDLTLRAFINRTLEEYFGAWPAGNVLPLSYAPLVSVTSVTYYDEDNAAAVLSSSDYLVITDTRPGAIELKPTASWPTITMRQTAPIVVRYVAGYGEAAASTPEWYKRWLRALVASMYEFRDEISPQGQAQLARIEDQLLYGAPLT